MIGQRFGKVEVLGQTRSRQGRATLQVRCDCGWIFPAKKRLVKKGTVTACLRCTRQAESAATEERR